MKYELKSVSYWPVIKISFVINLILGFIVGLAAAIFISLMIALMGSVAGLGGMPYAFEEMPSAGFLIVFYPFFLSIVCGIFNTILALIGAFIYNLSARLLGGLEFEFNQIQLPPAAYQPYMTPQAPPMPPAEPRVPPPPPVQPLPPDMIPPDNDTTKENSN
jgi:hypothetical protein